MSLIVKNIKNPKELMSLLIVVVLLILKVLKKVQLILEKIIDVNLTGTFAVNLLPLL